MAKFPSLLTTGGTVVIPSQPIQYQPQNLLPAIAMLAKQPKEEKEKAKIPGTDIELKGRIGAVDQVMSSIKRAQNKAAAQIDLYGDMAIHQPEYKQALNELEAASTQDILNTVARQTEDVDSFKKKINSEGWGHYFHLGEFLQTGDLKRMSQWSDIQERGYSAELGQAGDYKEGFDFNPKVYSMEQAREAADNIMDKEGYWKNERGWEKIKADTVGNMVGAMSTYQSIMDKQNYSDVDANGNFVGPVLGKSAAHQQALARSFSQMFDATDPLTAGYLQGFLQSKAGPSGSNPLEGYMKDGRITAEGAKKLEEDFGKFMQDDLDWHYEKRKINEKGQNQTLTFQETTDYENAGGADMTVIENIMNQVTEQQEGLDTALNIGIGIDNLLEQGGSGMEQLLNAYGIPTNSSLGRSLVNISEISGLGGVANPQLAGISQEEYQNLMFNEGTSPFTVYNHDGQSYYNVSNDEFKLSDFKDRAVEFAKEKGIRDPEAFAEALATDAYMQQNYLKEQIDNARGRVITGQQNIEKLVVRPDSVPNEWWDSVIQLEGQSASGFTNMSGQVGTTPINITSLGDVFKFQGAEGGIHVVPNTIKTNLGTIVDDPQSPSGKRVIYHASDEWRGLPEEKRWELMQGNHTGLLNKTAIDRALSVDKKTNESKGLDLWNMNKIAAVGAETSDAIPADETQMKLYARMAEKNPDADLSAVFWAPSSLQQRGIFTAPLEEGLRQLAKATPLKVEKPTSYVSIPGYKEEWDKTMSSTSKVPVYLNSWRKGQTAPLSGEKVMTPERIADAAEIPVKERDAFIRNLNTMPASTEMHVLQDLVVSAKTKGLNNWNYNNVKTQKVSEPAVINGKLTEHAQREYGVTYGVDEKTKQPTITIRPRVDLTGAAFNGKNKRSNETLKGLYHSLNKKYVSDNFTKTGTEATPSGTGSAFDEYIKSTTN